MEVWERRGRTKASTEMMEFCLGFVSAMRKIKGLAETLKGDWPISNTVKTTTGE